MNVLGSSEQKHKLSFYSLFRSSCTRHTCPVSQMHFHAQHTWSDYILWYGKPTPNMEHIINHNFFNEHPLNNFVCQCIFVGTEKKWRRNVNFWKNEIILITQFLRHVSCRMSHQIHIQFFQMLHKTLSTAQILTRTEHIIVKMGIANGALIWMDELIEYFMADAHTHTYKLLKLM